MTLSNRLTQLRQLMAEDGIDYYLVPTTDPHKNEYVPEHWQRRAWISGFTGSNGDVLVGMNEAYLWTDPRYFLQAEMQLNPDDFTLMKMAQGATPSLDQWVLQQPEGITLSVDPKLINQTQAHNLLDAIAAKSGTLLFIEDNFIDAIWQDQPPLPTEAIHLHEIQYAGMSVDEKLQTVRSAMHQQLANTLVMNSLEAICWLYNIRGHDINYNPMVVCNALVTHDQAYLYINPQKIPAQLQSYFKDNNITCKPGNAFATDLQTQAGVVWCDPTHCNFWIENQLQNADILNLPSPINLMKSIKNPTEKDGMRLAHIFDAVAVIQFMYWLEHHWHEGVTELSAAEKLASFRRENPACVDLSFETISGFGPHGAIIHYSVDQTSNITIDDSSLYLFDSGGQYYQGTTDITRTIHLGKPTTQQIHHYTLVLQGHLNIRQAVFPADTRGDHINALAHMPLWQEALDYGHGTGHGVGCYSCVHQFPPTISARTSNQAFVPGMVVSNEPGLYLENQYGIRIENLLLTKQVFSKEQSLSNHGPFYGFEDLTLVPYCRKLINTKQLSAQQLATLNTYHQLVYDTIKPYIENNALLTWLKQQTTAITQ